jgi:hypothetical protein
MLASALNGHPNISCSGELNIEDTFIVPSGGECKGAILMYNRWSSFETQYTANKLIHLVRDPETVSCSRMANSQSKKKLCTEHRAHFRASVDREFEISAEKLKEMTTYAKAINNRMRKKLSGLDHIEVSYEELTGNVSVTTINRASANRLTKFLGVPEMDLVVTDLVKPNTPYTLKES